MPDMLRKPTHTLRYVGATSAIAVAGVFWANRCFSQEPVAESVIQGHADRSAESGPHVRPYNHIPDTSDTGMLPSRELDTNEPPARLALCSPDVSQSRSARSMWGSMARAYRSTLIEGCRSGVYDCSDVREVELHVQANPDGSVWLNGTTFMFTGRTIYLPHRDDMGGHLPPAPSEPCAFRRGSNLGADMI